MNRKSFWDDHPDPYANSPLPHQQPQYHYPDSVPTHGHQAQPANQSQRSLLAHDTVVLQQVRNFMKDDFDILDTSGNPIGHVGAEGSTLSRMFMGSRSLLVRDIDGRQLFRIKDPVNFGFDTFEIYDASGAHLLALIKKKLSFLRARLDLNITGFGQCQIEGSFWGFSYTILAGDNPIANIDRQWSGFGREMLGHQRYALHISPNLPPESHAALIGTAIALDLMRKKQNSSSISGDTGSFGD